MLDRIRCIANLTLILSICLCNPYPGVAQELHPKARPFPKVLSALEDSSGNFLLLKLDSKTPLSAPLIHYLPGMAGQTVMVAEFENVLWLNSSQLIEPQVQEIDSIRLGQFQSNPPIFRISIATSNPAVLRKIEFQNHGSSLVIKLRGAAKHSLARSSLPQSAGRNVPNQNQNKNSLISATNSDREYSTSSPNLIPQPIKSAQPSVAPANQQLQRTGQFNHFLSPIENSSPPLAPSNENIYKPPLAAQKDKAENNATSCPIPQTRASKNTSNTPSAAATNQLAESCPVPTVTQIMAASQNQQNCIIASKKEQKVSGAGASVPFTAGGLLLQAKSEPKQTLALNSKEKQAGSLPSTGSEGAANQQFALRGPIELGSLTPPAAPPVNSPTKQQENPAESESKSEQESVESTKSKKTRAAMLISGSFLKKTTTTESTTAESGMPKEAPDFRITKSSKKTEQSLPNPAPDQANTASANNKTSIIKANSTDPKSSANAKTTITSSKETSTKPISTLQTSVGPQTTLQSTSTTKTSAPTVLAPAPAPDASSSAKSDKMPPPAPSIAGTQNADPQVPTVVNPQISVEGRNPVSLRLKFKDPVQYTTFALDDPPRFVIDLATPATECSSKALTADKNEFLKGIRFGTPDEEGKSTRIVLDLEKSDITVKDELDSARSTLTLTLQAGTAPKLASARGKLVVIDAGHGGSDPGAQRGDNNEKDMTLAIALKLKRVLEEQGIRTIMTRADDTFVSLEDRVRITNEAQPDAFVSVHINSLETDRDIQGIETYYQTEQSKILANKIHENLVGKLQVPDRYVRKARFYVINHTPHPAVLAEVGFISNKSERDKLISSDYQLKVADSIGQGVILFLSGSAEMPPIASRAVLPGSQASSSAISSTEKARLAQDETNVVKKNLANKEPSRRNNPPSGNKQIAQKVTDQKAIRKSGSKKKHFYSRHI